MVKDVKAGTKLKRNVENPKVGINVLNSRQNIPVFKQFF